MKKYIYMSLTMALALSFWACNDDETKDDTLPVITDTGITCNPIDCQVYHRGDEIPFRYVFEDDTELGNFNIEIHDNNDHHTHSTSSVECEEHVHESHREVNPWVYNKDFTIPAGLKSYTASIDISIPADIDEGDYHFMIRLTDKAGWQQIKSIAIRIEE